MIFPQLQADNLKNCIRKNEIRLSHNREAKSKAPGPRFRRSIAGPAFFSNKFAIYDLQSGGKRATLLCR